MKYTIKSRWTGGVRCEVEIECSADASDSVKLGLAVRAAVKAGANLAGADLTDAYLAGANLAGANLTGADLAGAYLAGANLAGANLVDAYLTGANLVGADLTGAKWRDGIIIKRIPLQLYGLGYPVTILDAHMQIGCELHTFDEWDGFADERISLMDGVNARRFWRDNKAALMLLCRSREVKEESKEEVAA